MLTGLLHAITLFTIGDSTMATYNETDPRRGWGQVFQQFFTADATVVNKGHAGRSTRTFYTDAGDWAVVKAQIKSGDFVLIQFAHNDENNRGIDAVALQEKDPSVTDLRGTSPWSTYKEYLRKYVNEVREKGGIPIFIAPICRAYFSGSSITAEGKHDLCQRYDSLKADGTILTNQALEAGKKSYDYVAQMKAVADEMSVPFIDLTTATAEMYEAYGETYCRDNLFALKTDGVTPDKTHTKLEGAVLIAHKAAQLLKDAGVLSAYIDLKSSLSVSPTTIDFGSGYVGQTTVKEVSITGFDLTPSEGVVTVTAPEGFKVSKAQSGPFTESTTFNYSGGNITAQRIYVQSALTTAGEKSGDLTIVSGEMQTSTAVSASAISLEGGSEVVVNWPFKSDAVGTVTGAATILDQSFEGMYAKEYRSLTKNKKGHVALSEPYTISDADTMMQANTINGGSWPAGEEDEVPGRYIQLGVTANQGTQLNIDSIGFYLVINGSNNFGCRVSYSKNADFSDATAIWNQTNINSSIVNPIVHNGAIQLKSGETLYIRIYPWNSEGSVKTGKYVCLKDFTIHGYATEATSVNENAVTRNGAGNKVKGVWTIGGKYVGEQVENLPAGVYVVNGEKVVSY